MANVTQKDIAEALEVIGRWTGAVVAELVAGDADRSAKIKFHKEKPVPSNPDYEINQGSSIAAQISITGAGIGKTC